MPGPKAIRLSSFRWIWILNEFFYNITSTAASTFNTDNSPTSLNNNHNKCKCFNGRFVFILGLVTGHDRERFLRRHAASGSASNGGRKETSTSKTGWSRCASGSSHYTNHFSIVPKSLTVLIKIK